MGLAWQQGPLATGSVGHFLTEQPLPPRLLFAEPLRRRMRVRFADQWIADSEDAVLLHEPGRYPVAYFPKSDIEEGILVSEDRVTQHKDLGDTQWFSVRVADREANHSAWQHTVLPHHAAVLDQSPISLRIGSSPLILRPGNRKNHSPLAESWLNCLAGRSRSRASTARAVRSPVISRNRGSAMRPCARRRARDVTYIACSVDARRKRM